MKSCGTGTEHNQVVLTRATWNAPVARGDAGLCAVLEQHAQMLLDSLPKGTGARWLLAVRGTGRPKRMKRFRSRRNATTKGLNLAMTEILR